MKLTLKDYSDESFEYSCFAIEKAVHDGKEWEA